MYLLGGRKETGRYLLVDTPLSKMPGMCIQPNAKEASMRNDELVRKGQVMLEFEEGNQRDNYGRLLAYVFADGDTQSVQETLLKEGYARVAYILNPPYKYLDVYLADENMAKREKRNI